MIIKTNGFKMPNGDIHTFIPPSPTENERGGIKAKAKTTEALEVAFDEASERLYAAIPNTDKTLSETGVAADAKTTGDKIKDKLDRNQGIEHYGKSLIVGEDGNVVPGEVSSGGGDGIAIINTMSGESPLAIPDSAERVNKRLELGGKTEQVQTTGAQLFEASRYEGVTKNGVTVTVKDGVITATGTTETDIWIQLYVTAEEYKKLFKPGEKIYIKTQKSSDCNYDFGIYGSFGSPALGTIREGNSGAALPTELPANDTSFYFFLDIKKGSALKGSIKPIVYHNGNGTWEPYTGGKPSPSPEYPQEIKNSGKWNEETQKYEVDVKITGKNLFDMNKFIDTCNFTKNEDGTFRIDKYVERYDCFIPANTILSIEVLKVEDSSGAAALELFYEDGKSMYIGFSLVGVKTFLIQKDVAYIKVLAYRKHEYKYIQLEKGRTATPYEPYKEQTLTLTSDRPITKWDKLVEQGGQIGWLYAGVVIDRFDGQSNKISIANKQGNVQNFSIRFENVANGNGNSDIFVDKYRAVQLSYTKAEYGICCNWNDGVKYFSAPNENVATVDEFKAWLIENPLKIAYETTNPEFIPLPQSEQNAIRALKTYYPTTVITNDQGCTMELDYVADTKNYIDNKFAQLQKSLINTNTQLL